MSRLWQSSGKRTRAIVLAAIAVVGIGLSLAGYAMLVRTEQGVVTAQYKADSEQRVRDTETRFRNDVTAIYSLSSFVRDSRTGTREDFRTTVRTRMTEDLDIVAAMWIPRVPAAERAAHEEAASRDGAAGYRLTERGSVGEFRERAAGAADLFPDPVHRAVR